MDCSPEYIKMCNCPEIQQYKVHRQTDMYLHKGIDGDEVMAGYNLTYVANSIWLPRQDQLQEMVSLDSLKERHWWYKGISLTECLIWGMVDFVDAGTHDYIFCMKGYAKQFISMEQLGLAFCMAEKYNKCWDGESWKLRQ